MKIAPYASVVGSLMYVMLCTRPDIYYVVGIVNIYQHNSGPEHWTEVKYIFKYLRRTRDYMLTYECLDLISINYIDSDFVSDMDSRKSTFRYVFTLGRASVS